MKAFARVIFLALAVTALASGAQKAGFIVGAGLGGGRLTNTTDYSFERYVWHSTGFTANIRTGYAFSKATEVYLFAAGHFVRGRVWETIGIGGVGVTRFVNPEGTGVFLCGGLGLSLFDGFDPGHNPGLGSFFGAGYGLSRRLSLRAEVLNARIRPGTSPNRGSESAVGIGLTLNVLLF
jgi:hypothetical protein